MTKFKISLRAMALASVMLMAVTGCGGGKDDDDNPPVQATTGSVSGRVADANTGEAIAGVEVKIGTIKATSDANGAYSMRDVPVGANIVAQFSKPSYASNFATVEVAGAKTSVADRRLAKVAVKQDVSAADGGVVTLAGSSARVALPAAGFVNAATGAAFSGTVSVEMTPVDPGIDPLNMPGNYRAQGEATPIQSFGALQVEMRDSAGALLNLAPGKTATIRIPVPTGAGSPPLSIPLYFFKESTGLWVREGTATLAGDVPRQYYEGEVSHFTVWNADVPYETIYINGCVVNASGQPLDASVVTEGLDYIGYASAQTTADGKFKVAARRNSKVEVTAQSGVDRASVAVTTGGADLTLPACLVIDKKAPVILEQPVNLTIAPGMVDHLSVSATNGEQYTWYKDGTLIDTGSRHLPIVGHSTAAGNYYVVVSNSNGSVTSATIIVTVAEPLAAPLILSHPKELGVVAGAYPTFTVEAQGQSLTYQWLRNGVEIAGAQGPSLNMGLVAVADNGALFSVRVANRAGNVVSTGAILTVTSEAVAPGIALQPSNASVSVGQSATFGVRASGTGPFAFQWLLNGTAIANATSATYSTPATVLLDSGARYTVQVTNAKGSVVSEAATLTVNAASSLAGLYLPFVQDVGVNGMAGYGVIPAVGGAPIASFWPSGQGALSNYLMQATVNNGTVSGIHVRGLMFTNKGQLIRRDLIGANGLPAEVRVSSLSLSETCNVRIEDGPDFLAYGPDVVDMNRSWSTFSKRGVDTICNTADDEFIAVRSDMGPTVAPVAINRPVAAINSPQGALTGWILRNGQQMQRVNADFSNPVTLFTLPGADLYFDHDNSFNNHWVFRSGGKIYAVDLNAAAPATLTEVATLYEGERLHSVTYANEQDVIISLSDYRISRIVRYVSGTRAVNTIATGLTVSNVEAVTATRVITHNMLGTIIAFPLAGGAQQTVYTPPEPTFTYTVGQRGGERIWQDMADRVISVNSDATGLLSFPGKMAGCILKPQSPTFENSLSECDAVIIIDNSIVRSYDAQTGALRLTYGAVRTLGPNVTGMTYFDFFTAWGGGGVLTQFVYDNATLKQVAYNYFIKTDQAGLTRIELP